MTSTTVSYLGPPGTYGHQAAQAFGDRLLTSRGRIADLRPCTTISAVYASESDYLVMPLQNTLHGAVLETLDCLLSCLSAAPSRKGKERELNGGPTQANGNGGPARPRLVASLDLHIQHCLVGLKGTKLEDIQWVRSHEQALGQSARFLSTRLPGAERQKWASTAGAAVSLLDGSTSSSDAGILGPGAAICSRTVADLHPLLEILHVGTQDISDNYTRFIMLSRRDGSAATQSSPAHDSAASHFYALDHPSLLSSVLAQTSCRAVHSRPAPPDAERTTERRFPIQTLVETSGPIADVMQGVLYLGAATHLGEL